MVTKKKETTGHLLVQSAYTSEEFIVRLTQLGVKSAIDNSRYFRGDDRKNKFLGVQMSAIFSLAKQFTQMPLPEVKQLLASNFYEARMGAVSIMDFQARDRKITAIRRKELYNIYMEHHDRINNWDLVDRSAPYVVGGYLFDRSRAPLYKLAKSKNVWERRTAIVSTYYFIRQNDLADTFKIAAGESSVRVSIRFLRHEDLLKKSIRLALKLEENEHFKLLINEYKNTKKIDLDKFNEDFSDVTAVWRMQK